MTRGGQTISRGRRQQLRQLLVDVRAGSVAAASSAVDWRLLWEGRWTVVDTFHRYGLRWVIARGATPGSRPRRALKQRERDVVLAVASGQSLKTVAFDLGLPLGTVASTLRRAMTKLRVETRAELSALLAAVSRAPSPGSRGPD